MTTLFFSTKRAVQAIGAALLAIGLLGYIKNPVFGIFAMDGAHSFIYIVSGLLALTLALRDEHETQQFAKVVGFAYGVVSVLGFIVPDGLLLGVLEANLADHIFHAVVAVALLYVGFWSIDREVVYREGVPRVDAGEVSAAFGERH